MYLQTNSEILCYFAQKIFMFENKVVVVTGGTEGIGRSLVEQFLQRKALVATCARSIEKIEQLKTGLPHPNLFILQCDVSEEASAKKFVEETILKFGKIDILVNNAGISMRSLFKDVSLDAMKKVMDVNFWGAVHCTKFALDSLIQQKGIIVGVSSIAGYRGLPGRSGYSASKFALNGWMEALKTELIDEGVHVMWVAPGFTQSNVRKAALTKDGGAQGQSPLNESKLMTADECAAHIINAIKKKKRNLVLTFKGKQTVFMNKFFPKLTDRLTRNFFFKNGKLTK